MTIDKMRNVLASFMTNEASLRNVRERFMALTDANATAKDARGKVASLRETVSELSFALGYLNGAGAVHNFMSDRYGKEPIWATVRPIMTAACGWPEEGKRKAAWGVLEWLRQGRLIKAPVVKGEPVMFVIDGHPFKSLTVAQCDVIVSAIIKRMVLRETNGGADVPRDDKGNEVPVCGVAFSTMVKLMRGQAKVRKANEDRASNETLAAFAAYIGAHGGPDAFDGRDAAELRDHLLVTDPAQFAKVKSEGVKLLEAEAEADNARKAALDDNAAVQAVMSAMKSGRIPAHTLAALAAAARKAPGKGDSGSDD